MEFSGEVVPSKCCCQCAGLHPLFIDHVLQEVFLHLDDNQVALMRLVCRQWNFVATEIIRSRVTLTFNDVGKLKRFNEFFSVNTGLPPFVKYKLGGLVFQLMQKESLDRFLEIFGSQIESLNINQDNIADYKEDDINTEVFSLTNIKSFVYVDKRVEVDERLVILSTILKSSCQTIEKLSISFPRNNSPLISTIFMPVMKNLKSLKLDMKITDGILTSISESGMRLRKLNLSLRASNFSQESLRMFLSSQTKTLQELKLTNLYRRAEISVEIPQLDRLTLLEVHGCEIPAYNITFPYFSYKKIPSIRKLFLNTWAATEEWEKFLPRNPNENIQHLSLSMNFDEAPLMQRVSKVFPQLKKLEMYFCRGAVDALVVVFGEILTLEELTLYQSFLGEVYDTNMDDVLTGLTAQECQWILSSETYHRVDLASMRSRPGLDNLKKLEKLDMSSLQYRNIITDVTGYLVFLKMIQLKNLFIGCTQIGEVCLEKLVQRFSANILVGRRDKQNLDYSIIQEICNCVII